MSLLARAQRSISVTFRRNIGFTAIVAQKGQATDPIQKLFLQSIREYDQKSKAAGGKMVEPSPETEKEMKTELERITKTFGGNAGDDMTKLPPFSFKDPVIDPLFESEAK